MSYKISDIVGYNNQAEFVSYANGALRYRVRWDFGAKSLEFTVPVEDTGGATFKALDKAIFFMRWIRRALKDLDENGVDTFNGHPSGKPDPMTTGECTGPLAEPGVPYKGRPDLMPVDGPGGPIAGHWVQSDGGSEHFIEGGLVDG